MPIRRDTDVENDTAPPDAWAGPSSRSSQLGWVLLL